MNPVEQRAHRKVTADLTSGIEEVASAAARRLDAMERRVMDAEQYAMRQVGEERTHRLKLADEQRSYVDAELRSEATFRRENDNLHIARIEALEALRSRGLWGRLRWIALGR